MLSRSVLYNISLWILIVALFAFFWTNHAFQHPTRCCVYSFCQPLFATILIEFLSCAPQGTFTHRCNYRSPWKYPGDLWVLWFICAGFHKNCKAHEISWQLDSPLRLASIGDPSILERKWAFHLMRRYIPNVNDGGSNLKNDRLVFRK